MRLEGRQTGIPPSVCCRRSEATPTERRFFIHRTQDTVIATKIVAPCVSILAEVDIRYSFGRPRAIVVNAVTALAQSGVSFCITELALCSATLARSIPHSALELQASVALVVA